MRPLKIVLTMLLLAGAASAYTLDTEHPLYGNMKGIYVFDNRTDDGDNIAGTGTMVGAVEDGDGFDTPITQSFQSWYNNFGTGYTICIWHDGMTLGAWEGIFTLWSDEDGAALTWQRNNLVDEVKVFHNATAAPIAGLNMADVAGAQMLALRWDEAYVLAYDDGVWIAQANHATDPATDNTTAAISIGGQCTVTRVYIFDDDIGADAIAALAADPDSIFTSESGPSGAQIFTEGTLANLPQWLPPREGGGDVPEAQNMSIERRIERAEARLLLVPLAVTDNGLSVVPHCRIYP